MNVIYEREKMRSERGGAWKEWASEAAVPAGTRIEAGGNPRNLGAQQRRK